MATVRPLPRSLRKALSIESSFRFVVAILLIFIAVTFSCNTYFRIGTSTPSIQNPIQIENAKTDTTGWQLTNPATNHEIEGYASATSVDRGGQIQFFVNTVDSSYTLQVFPLGWYGGLGGRQMTNPVTLPGTQQVIPSPDPTTGIVECHWKNPYTLTIPNSSDPTDWTSGIYVAKLTGVSSGRQSYIIFVV